MKSIVSFLLSFANHIAARMGYTPTPIIMLEVREASLRTSGWSKLHVYVKDDAIGALMERLTGTRTLRPRHLHTLSMMGFTFAIDRTIAQTVPVWLCNYIGAQNYLPTI